MGDSASPPSSTAAPTRARRPQPHLDTRNLGSLLTNDHDILGQRSPAPSPRVAEELPTVHEPYKKFNTRHTNKPDLGPKWHKEYSEIDVYSGRVLIIDFIKQASDECQVGMRKVTAQEIYDLEHLRRVYTNPERNSEAVLRVFHVQNAEWAIKFLLRKFNIDNRDDLVGTDFGRYVRHKRPERRGGKPFLSGKTWKVQYDPWRGISKTSFSLDYFKQYRPRDPMNREARGPHEEDDSLKMMELNCFDEDDNPKYGYDVYVQRVSCYIQHKQTAIEVPTNPDIKNPYIIDPPKTDSAKSRTKHEYIPRLDTLDNGNAILIFDNSHTNSIEDTLIAARRVWESRWRRLPFFLAFESRDFVATDEQLAFQCSRIILEDIFKALVMEWDTFLDLAMDHVSILEDKVYEQPADETRAPELWLNSNLWLKVEKLLFIHIDVVKEMRPRLGELEDDLETDDTWLDNIPGDYDRLSTLVEEDLVKPTKTLISLLYQSVSIRDSRHSIQLGVSMWRLSWITFIFLPLTFIVGFFGMNVDTFADNPSIKWYFISCVPFMLSVLAAWYIVKHVIARQRQTPYQRGIYENFFHNMATDNPSLWSRAGPRDYVRPKGRLARLKWYLIRRWTAPEKTIQAKPDTADHGVDSLGAVSKLKRYLICRWTSQIAASQPVDPSSVGSLEAGEANYDIEASDLAAESHVVAEGLAEATEMLVIPATPIVEGTFAFEEATARLAVPAADTAGDEGRLSRRWSRRHRHQSRNSSGNTSSGILVEEEDFRWLSERGKEGKRFMWRSSSSRDRSEASKEGGEGKGEADKDNKQGGSASGAEDHEGDVAGGVGDAGEQSPEETRPRPEGVSATPQVIKPPD
ncbi:hypothetical protein GX50_08580 [[Emmonsia] crescens]|uniref:Magnesium transporter n=1 Tax=[Emmonsia] crescens TaxID=73230 RepID=A0A2B7Z780_9EURO|nr:hypothetical protein GX50_08580 [Emmonsia crescens]